MSKDQRCASAATYQHAKCKQITERSFGQPWKPYKGFWVPKQAILTDSQYLQLGANGRAQQVKGMDNHVW